MAPSSAVRLEGSVLQRFLCAFRCAFSYDFVDLGHRLPETSCHSFECIFQFAVMLVSRDAQCIVLFRIVSQYLKYMSLFYFRWPFFVISWEPLWLNFDLTCNLIFVLSVSRFSFNTSWNDNDQWRCVTLL